MKILYLTPGCFDKGGISRYCRYQISALRQIVGVENVSVHSLLGPGPDDFEDSFPVTKYAGGNTAFKKAAFVCGFAPWAMINRPQAIFSAHVSFSAVAKVLGAVTGARTFLNVYGLEVWSGLDRDAAWGLKKADQVISDCHYTSRYLEENGLREKETVLVAWDCVDLQKFSPALPSEEILSKYGIPDPATGINILTLGRLSHDAAYKGYERLLDVFGRIAFSQDKLRLIYAGRGEMIDFLREKARKLGVSDKVFFTGSIHENDLPDIYRSAHIFSLVTDSGTGRGEGIPLTPLEAAACGVPILVSNHDGSQEAVIDNENGFVLDPFDLDEIERVLVLLSTDEKLRTNMARSARLRAERDFGFDSFTTKHKNLLATWFPREFASRVGEQRTVPENS
jgi:phosphatidylinositol alpha-1,6-mannosyltransferase